MRCGVSFHVHYNDNDFYYFNNYYDGTLLWQDAERCVTRDAKTENSCERKKAGFSSLSAWNLGRDGVEYCHTESSKEETGSRNSCKAQEEEKSS